MNIIRRPPMKMIIETKDGQPDTGSPQISARTTTIIKKINEIKHITSPKIEDTYSGVVLYAIKPSSAYLNNFQNDHLVCPALRTMFS